MALKKAELYGPTHFAEVLREVRLRSESKEISQNNQCYEVLLILTDGIINDLQESIAEVV